ncbi:MAG TPA: phosphotransferase [Dehalococcoidia bacterium]|jgi:Ser/Thr protein kinase RdoA (MazF antagonist)
MDEGVLCSLQCTLRAWGPRARTIAPAGGGNRSSVWQVQIGGERFAARRSLRPAPAVHWELRLLDFLASHGVHVATPVPALGGRRLIDGWSLFTWLDGDPPTSQRDWRLVAAELDRIHTLTRGWHQRPGFRSTRQLLTASSGGDVRLDLMPPDAVVRCRAAWRRLAASPRSAIHGDPGAENIRVSAHGVAFLDWDEARVDVSLLDFADLPIDLSDWTGPVDVADLRRAAHAWEAANGWLKEPDYARRRLALL